jgi:hypothetical protein
MALSVAVLIIPIFILLVVYRVFFAGDAPIPVDAAGTYATARHSAHYTVLEPAGLPSGWTAISATFGTDQRGGTLRVSYVPPARTGLQLIESDQSIDTLLPTELGNDARPGNLETIAGRQWRVYPETSGGARALVLADNGRTTILVGTASDGDLREFAAALR